MEQPFWFRNELTPELIKILMKICCLLLDPVSYINTKNGTVPTSAGCTGTIPAHGSYPFRSARYGCWEKEKIKEMTERSPQRSGEVLL